MEAITATVIGVVGTALFAMIFMQFQHLRQDMAAGFQAANRDLKAQGHEIKALDEKFTGEFKALNEKFTGELKAQGHELKALEIRLTDKFTGEIKALDHLLRGHGERLARIEAKLEIEPPAEAA
ncbi:hypothetical protein [Candidatus Poriferisocius sp.]|uniref:hypothetical protein n=1 Tax=Candidatus Poriferisocius sp. TaxID=3101276 RepID=UPI003B0194C9